VIGVGILGAGFFGELHAVALRRVEGLRLVGAWRRDSTALASFCRAYDCRAYADPDELIEAPEVDVVVIATPHYLHTAYTLSALQASKAVWLEKPMAATLSDSQRILAAATASSRPFTVGFINRFARAYQVAKGLLDSGELGTPVQGISTMSKQWLEPNRRQWHMSNETGGGMWLTAGIHCLDRLTWLMSSRLSSVTGRFDTRFHSQEADDVGTVLVDYDSGATGVVISTGYAVGAPKHTTELVCTEGTLSIDYDGGVRVGRNEQWTQVPSSGTDSWLPGALERQWREFLYALVDGKKSPVTAEYAFHIMEAAFAARESARTHQSVPVLSRYA